MRTNRRSTNPQIGNYGTNQADNESARPYIEGLIVREFSPIGSNWRSELVTDEYMERYSVPVLAEIDTRALVRHLRTHASCARDFDGESDTDLLMPRLAASARWTGPTWPASSRPSRSLPSTPPTAATRRAILSSQSSYPGCERAEAACGGLRLRIKLNILRMLVRDGCRVTVFQPRPAPRMYRLKPDGVFLSNGPGDPGRLITLYERSANFWARARLRHLPGPPAHGSGPRGRTYKLKFGHHGGNHPVKTTSPASGDHRHNHNFAVDPDSINANEVELTH